MNVLIQGVLRLVAVPLTLFILLLEMVALVEIRTVLRPRPFAHPAPLVVAAHARHVVAATIFFRIFFTSRTRFTVGENPIGCFRIVYALLGPLR